MAIRRKTVKRLAIIAAVAAALGGAAEVVVHQRQARRENWLAALREQGVASYNSGDYAAAAEALDRYLSLHDADDAAITAFAASKTRASVGSYQNLQSAQARVELALSTRPGNLAVEHALLQLCTAGGDVATAERISDEVLAANPDDPAALEARVNTRLRQGRFDDALAAARQRAAAKPGELDAHLAVMQLMMRLHKSSDDVIAYAAGFDPSPQAPASLLLGAIAVDYAGRHADAVAMLRAAAFKNTADAGVAGQIVNLFDVFKLFDEGDAYLEAAVNHGGGADLHRALALRLWQQEKYDQFLKNLPDTGDAADSAVLAIKVAALFETNRPADADAAMTALHQRSERIARAWTIALGARYTATATPGESAKQFARALSRDPDNGVIRAWLGDCYASAGELTLAIHSWTAAAARMPGWSTPCLKTSAAMLRQGRPAAAVQAAANAYDRRPNTETAIHFARVRMAALDASPRDPDEERDLLSFIEKTVDAPAADAFVPIRIALLARAGRRVESQTACDEAIQTAKRWDSETTLAFISTGIENGLANTDQIFESIDVSRCSPALMLARANWLVGRGKTDQATAEMAVAVRNTVENDCVNWRVAQCQLLDAASPAVAAAAWRKLASDFRSSAVAQNAVCEAALAHQDLWTATVADDQLRALTGDLGEQWRLHRATLLADGVIAPSASTRQSDGVEAVTILTDVVREAPGWIAPRLQLARALTTTGNAPSAIEHLKAAAAMDPSSVSTVLELVTLLRQENRGDEVPRVLHAFAPPVVIADAQRMTLAATMADAGQSENAVALLAGAEHTLPPPGRLLLAEQYRQIGDADRAAKIYDDLLAGSPSPAALASAVEFHATHARGDLARQILQRLAASDASAADIAIATGRFEERFGSEAVALEQFKKAADTQGEAGAVALIDFHLRRGHTVEAAAAARQAVARLPASRILGDRLIEAEAASARVRNPAGLRSLIDALSHDPSRAAEVATLTALNGLGASSIPQDVLTHKLRQISGDFPADLPLAQQTVSMCVRQQDTDAAVLVARQTMAALPNDPAAARLAVDALRAGRRWGEMREAAEQWQARLNVPSIDATAALAEAMLGQGDADGAMNVLQPLREAIATDARGQPMAATVLSRVLLSSGHYDQALSLIGPLFRDAAGRRSGRDLARSAAPTLAAALACFDAVNLATPSTVWEEQNAQADLLTDIGRKFGDKSTLVKAAAHYHEYLKACPTDSDAILNLAGIEQQTGDVTAAESRLRDLIGADPSYAAAKNDLACLLLSQQRQLPEAERLARGAVAAAPGTAAFQDTLARVLFAAGRPADARTAFQTALRLDPNLVPARVGLARLMHDQGDLSSARTELRRVDGTLKANPRAGEFVADELTTLRAELTQLDQ